MSVFSNLKTQETRLRTLLSGLPDSSRSKILSALSFAKSAHGSQMRDEGSPYVIHPIRATCTLIDMGISSVDILCAMLLHDVVEDTGIPIEEIQRQFGKRTAKLVANVTRPRPLDESDSQKKESKKNKYATVLTSDPDTRMIKCADMLDNIQSWSAIPKNHPSRQKLARWYREVEQFAIPIAEKTDERFADEIRKAFDAARKECEG